MFSISQISSETKRTLRIHRRGVNEISLDKLDTALLPLEARKMAEENLIISTGIIKRRRNSDCLHL